MQAVALQLYWLPSEIPTGTEANKQLQQPAAVD